MSSGTALIAGVTGVVGISLARRLVSTDWKVYGLSRRQSDFLPGGVNHILCDLQDASKCADGLKTLKDVTHVFYTTWVSTMDPEKDCDVNRSMLANLMDNLPSKIKHFALLTGAKHYIGNFGDVIGDIVTPIKETMERRPGRNFYHDLEDEVFGRAKTENFTWSVARPMAIVGFAPNTTMNIATGLAIYATLCKEMNLPFQFFGGEKMFNCLSDLSDAEQVADHMIWESTEPKAANQGYNVVNGDVFRWKQMWAAIAKYFNLEVPEYNGEAASLTAFMDDKTDAWETIVKKYGLYKTDLQKICAWWFMDVVGMLPIEVVMDMANSRELGFLKYQNTEKSFFKTFDYLKEANIIPKGDGNRL
ncbi:unnamed protein product [Owenia fusiformis]|uniref:PRISE-like Rossmann-fold domain-containing protein n=1 Tax=Owenia fusiformis TaxID=6347 RepID=A0A8J1XXB5_OWEFU|nr:unnamed protein product [Owenia fusiformis]